MNKQQHPQLKFILYKASNSLRLIGLTLKIIWNFLCLRTYEESDLEKMFSLLNGDGDTRVANMFLKEIARLWAHLIKHQKLKVFSTDNVHIFSAKMFSF